MKPGRAGGRGRAPRRLRANRAEISCRRPALGAPSARRSSRGRGRVLKRSLLGFSTLLFPRAARGRSRVVDQRWISCSLSAGGLQTECEDWDRRGTDVVERNGTEVAAVPAHAAIKSQDPEFARRNAALTKGCVGKRASPAIHGAERCAGDRVTITASPARESATRSPGTAAISFTSSCEPSEQEPWRR